MVELIYSETCPYCQRAERLVRTLDVRDIVETTPIESKRGERLVTEHHDEFVHAPHLFTDDLVYYGVLTTVLGLVREVPKEYLRRTLPFSYGSKR